MVGLRQARVLAGMAAVFTLLGLFVAEFFYPGQVDESRIRILLGLIAALLGVDLAGEHLPLNVEITNGSEREGDDES